MRVILFLILILATTATAETVTFRIQGNTTQIIATFANTTTSFLANSTFDQTFRQEVNPPAANTTELLLGIGDIVANRCIINLSEVRSALTNDTNGIVKDRIAEQIERLRGHINEAILPAQSRLSDLESNTTSCQNQLIQQRALVNTTQQALNSAQDDIEDLEDEKTGYAWAAWAGVILLIALLVTIAGGRWLGYTAFKRGPS